ncbi:MAG: hypothetical protein H0U43_06845 [Chthoniobacterales bacterium]|nr:hypothetical protein [Chthoniobacterales bacterium]
MATELKEKIEVGLVESRMVVLVVQVLLGFACRAPFEPGFEKLPPLAQTMKMVSFALLIVTLALLLAIPAYHRIAAGGENTRDCEAILRRFTAAALCPFATALGIDVGLASFVALGASAGVITAVAVTGIAVTCWYAVAYIRRASTPSKSGEDMEQKTEATPIKDKIKQVLTECRIVLPGTQAFLGFQLSAFLTDAFAKLPRPEQLLHLGALGLVALSGIILMTPAAYHRIAEKGNMTPQFLRLASILLLCAMVPFALGICVDFYVVLSKVIHAPGVAFGIATAAFLTFAGLWFAFPMWSRHNEAGRGSGSQTLALPN